jgi:hypothetical protein
MQESARTLLPGVRPRRSSDTAVPAPLAPMVAEPVTIVPCCGCKRIVSVGAAASAAFASAPAATKTVKSRRPLIVCRADAARPPTLRGGASSPQPSMFTARAATSTSVTIEIDDCSNINSFAFGVSGSVSAGLNAEAFVNDK